MTATHVALFRGINVGKAKRIAMADLRALLEALGHTDVRTLLNSGNVVFTPARSATPQGELALRIETALLAERCMTSRVTVLTAVELVAILEKNPLRKAAAAEPSRVLIAIPRASADLAQLRSHARADWSPETLALGPRAAYLHCPAGTLSGRLATVVDRALGERVTARNAATMEKLRAILAPQVQARRTR